MGRKKTKKNNSVTKNIDIKECSGSGGTKGVLAEKIYESDNKKDIIVIDPIEPKVGKIAVFMPTAPVIVIPYIMGPDNGQELKWALRGWEKNMPEAKIVIVGEKPEWLNTDTILFIPCPNVSSNPPLDIVNKMLAIIDCEYVPETFIWANDDQYPMKQISIANLMVQSITGKLEDNVAAAVGKYKVNKQKTIDFLKSAKLPTNDFSSHLPFCFEKSKLKELIQEFELDKNSYLISSLYFNLFFPEKTPVLLNFKTDKLKCGIYRQNPDVNTMKNCLKTKLFFNNSVSGYSEVLVKFMNEVFPKASKHEIEKKN